MSKINLIPKITVIGYSQLSRVKHTRIKARSKEVNTSCFGPNVDRIREEKGSYTSEYRLVKEKQGYIFREVLMDIGINGHHKTMKRAIVAALRFVDIYVDENFEHESLDIFKKYKKFHQMRDLNCKHKNAFFMNDIKREYCPDCGIDFYKV